jgi:multifunctional beta-oxidation protein
MRSSRVGLFSQLSDKAAALRSPIAGGSAVAAVCSAEDGDEIVKVALGRFGAVHVLIANAGILRDKSFTAMSEKEWDQVIAVHLRYLSLLTSQPSAETSAGALIRLLAYRLTIPGILILCAVCQGRMARLSQAEVWPYFDHCLWCWNLCAFFSTAVAPSKRNVSDGNFGQANYSTAKAAIIGFTRAVAIEGKKYNIFANALAPSAGTAMTQTIW